MYREDTIERFIELRAQAWSLGHIASELHTAKRTLVEWSREYAVHIESLRALEQQILQEKILASREEDLARLLRLQKDVEDELANRTLRLVDTEKLFRMSKRMEETVKAEKGLNPNVDFYSASTYYALGIPVDLFTPIFAVSRVSGWTAHCLEQYANNRLIRPRTDYIGPPYPQTFLPLDQR